MTMAHRQCWSFHSAGRIVFGSGSVARLAEFLDPWKPTRVLIVTDRMLVQAGVVDRVAAPLLAAGLDVSRFEGGQPEPSCAIAEAAFSAAKTQRPDVIVAERGVRFIQVQHGAGGAGKWDAHGDLKTNHEKNFKKVDKPIAGLLKDLKQRGLLDSTIVIFATEFGRTPASQGTDGRDHHPYGFSVWMAGGGLKRGIVHGATKSASTRSSIGTM